MQSSVRWVLCVLVTGLATLPAHGAFSSLYVFGDGVCSTTGGPGGALYYQNTYCNGRVWVQVLAQRQAVTYQASNNPSDEWHDSAVLLTQLNSFSASDAGTSLFVVWVADADFVDLMQYTYPDLTLSTWNNAINTALNNHAQALSTLYAKGARVLVMPNAVDITKVAAYYGASAADKTFIRGRVAYFNSSFANLLAQARAAHPDLTIICPDFFALLDNMDAHPATYGLVNHGTDALDDPNLTDYSLTGPGAYYIFWDPWDPTAKAHEIMADVVQQMLSPVRISKLALVGASNRLDAVNMPIGLGGYVQGRTNLSLGSWTSLTNFNSVTSTQVVFVPAAGVWRYYRLQLPFAWTWP